MGSEAASLFEHRFEGSKIGEVDPVRQQDRIVRPIDTPRLTAATRGVSQRMGDVLNRAGAHWEPRLLASLYAAAALRCMPMTPATRSTT